MLTNEPYCKVLPNLV